MKGEFSLDYNYEEFLAAGWLMLRKAWPWRRAIRVFAILALAIFSVGAVDAVVTRGFDADALLSAALTALMAGLVGLGAALLAVLALFPRSVRKSFETLGRQDTCAHYSYDDTRLLIRDAVWTGAIEWHRLVQWTENDRFLMIYETDCRFYYIPKRQVDTETLHALKDRLLAATVPKV